MADLRDVVQGDYSQVDESTLCFETIPIYKIILFSILTLGLYQVLWFYRNWKILKIKFGYKVSPFWRAIFAPLTNYKLFPIMQKYVKSFDNIKSFNADSLAYWYLFGCVFDIFITLVNYFNGKHMWRKTLGVYFSEDLFLAIIMVIGYSILSFFFTIPIIARIQARINKINKQDFSNAPKNKLYGIKTVLLILIGRTIPWTLHVLILTLIIYCLFPVTPQDQCYLGDKYKNINVSRALKWYEKSANQGYAEAQYKLAMMYQEGKGVPQDFAKAVELYEKLTNQDYKLTQEAQYKLTQEAQYKLAQKAQYKLTQEAQYELAQEAQYKLAQEAQYKLAMIYQNGKGVTQNLQKACELYKTIKLQKNIIYKGIKFNLKKMSLGKFDYFVKYLFNNRKKIIGYLFEEIEHLQDIYRLSQHEPEKDVKPEKDVISYFRFHNLRETYNEQCKLGVMYEEGIGVAQDLLKAHECYQQAASQKSIFANYMLGVMYEEGIGVTQDLSKACEYYRSMADYYLHGCRLGIIYEGE